MARDSDKKILESLLEWWIAHRGQQPDAREIADWLWLNTQLEGVPLPSKFALERNFSSRKSERGRQGEDRSSGNGSFADQDNTVASTDQPERIDPQLPSFFPEEPTVSSQQAEPVARLLSPSALPEADDVKEALQRRAGALPLLLSQVPLLPRSLPILQALHPLLRRQPHPRWRVLDEGRSAVRSAETRRPWPIFLPRKVPAVRVSLWLDGGVSMAVWQPLAEELQRILASSQAFARVELKTLDPASLPEAKVLPRGGNDFAEGKPLTLLLTDTAGRHWWDGSIDAWLMAQACHQPVAILHTLPIRYWKRSALQRGEQVTLSNRQALTPNRNYRAVSLKALNPWKPASAGDLSQPEGLRLPVITLDPRELAPWAALVMGDSLARTGGTVLPPTDLTSTLPVPEPVARRAVELTPSQAERLWLTFRQQASPEAQRLVLVMAAAPLLTLPVMRLLLAAELPEVTNPLPLAEVLVSGLVRRLPAQGHGSPDRIQFELLPPIQRLLEPRVAPKVRIEVIQAVTDLLERRWNRQGIGPSFETLLTDPLVPLPEEAAGLAHIANVTAAMLDRLPGKPFHHLAQRLRAGVGEGPAPIWPEAMVFQEKAFTTAQFLPIPEPTQIAFTTARFQEIELHEIPFKTATLRIGPEVGFRAVNESWQQARVQIHHSTASTWAFFEPLQRDGLLPGDVVDEADPLTLTMVEIPAGDFQMGSPKSEPERYNDEGPQHLVQLEGFFMARTPITQAQWRSVAGWQPRNGEEWGRDLNPDPSHFQRSEARLLDGERSIDERPVERVSWHDAMEFCSRLSQRTGRSYTLPSEAQWEYACRAGTSSPFHFGETITPALANYAGNFTNGDGPKGENREQTTPVGSFPDNAWGLHDTHGNVWEWCLDHWHGSYEGAPDDGSAWLYPEAGEGAQRLLRGGSWSNDPRHCRSAHRYLNVPGNDYSNVGFRVVCLP